MKKETIFNHNFFVMIGMLYIFVIWLTKDISEVGCWHIGVLLISFYLVDRIEMWSCLKK